MNAILVEAFGSIVNENLRVEDTDLDEVMAVALQRLDSIVGLDDVETVYTGMNGDVTFALQDAVETLGMDVEIQAFYPNVSEIAEEDDIEYNQAWKNGFTWRNNCLFVEDEEDDQRETVGLTVRVGDAGNNGEALLQHARRKGVPALDINLDELVQKDEAYGEAEDSEPVPDPDEAQA